MGRTTQTRLTMVALSIFAAIGCWFIIAIYFNTQNILVRSIARGDLASVAKYLDHGGDPNLVVCNLERRMAMPILQFSIQQQNLEITTYLLKRGANPNLGSYNKQTAIMRVVGVGMTPNKEDTLLELLLPVSDLTAKDDAGWTLLHHVAAFGTSKQYNRILRIAPELSEVKTNSGHLPEELRRFHHHRN